MNTAIINLFLDLVKIDSPTGEEANVLKYVNTFLKRVGINPHFDDFGNLHAKIDGFLNPILLSAHADTVEPGRNIKPKIIDGIIKSDGKTILGADNKVGLAVILDTIRELIEKKIPHRNIEFVVTRSEESGNYGAINLNYSHISAKIGYIFDNSNPIGTIIYASPFYYRFDMKFIGKAAHASSPQKAINVLPAFSDFINSIKLGRINEQLIANIGVINSGHVRNSIPGELYFEGEVRGFKNDEVQEFLNILILNAKKSAYKFGCKIKYETVCENSGYMYYRNDQFIKETIVKMRLIKRQFRLKKSLGCSDANIFQEHGIKVLDLGDGSKNSHTVNESIEIKNLLNLKSLLISLVT